MIRLPPSLLTLGPRDLVEYQERRQQRETEKVKQKFGRFEIGSVDGPNFGRFTKFQSSDSAANASGTDALLTHTQAHDRSLGGDGYEELQYPIFQGPPPSPDQSSIRSALASPENASQFSVDEQQSSSPPKDGFHYGGFNESRSPRRSSPFAPEDISTPQDSSHNRAGIRMRTLPRSPLYFSHNASSSPERPLTSSLTPRVASRVANHHTPGIIFSQPPRRPATFRHQTNSFSFDSSERSSAAYEQDRISSISTTDTTPRPSQSLRLHDELHGSSLNSSRVSSAGATTFSSPQLPLPAPFSTRSRRVSDALPSANPTIHVRELSDSEIQAESSAFVHPATSPADRSYERSDHTFQTGDGTRTGIQPRGGSNPVGRSHRSNHHEAQTGSSNSKHPGSSPIASATRLNDFIRSSAARIVSYYRPSTPSTSTGSPRAQSLRSRYPRTPGRLAVYNDALPPHTQPQTPVHLPESRHQSRYHPAYTAPIPRVADAFRIGTRDVVPRPFRAQVPTTPSRRSRVSPAGLQRPGFRGLYGGIENGDDEQSWVEGVRFSNAEVRLWGLRDAAGDGRTLGDTPEREEWRVGRH